MGPGELALVLAVIAAVASATWVSRDARRRGSSTSRSALLATLTLVTFPLGAALYARSRHRGTR